MNEAEAQYHLDRIFESVQRLADAGFPMNIVQQVGPCPCECNSGGFCGGCGHAGCGGRR